MKLFSQQGFGDGEKTISGARMGVIDGVIISPKDVTPNKAIILSDSLYDINPSFEVLIDPQFYVSLHSSNPSIRLGNLEKWPMYKSYRREDLEDPRIVDTLIRKNLKFMDRAPVSGVIMPNINISKSFDSIEGSISKSFIRRAAEVNDTKHYTDKPIYCTLSVSLPALTNEVEFQSYMNFLTSLPSRPHGFYIIACSKTAETVNDIYDPAILKRLMFMNYALSINGFKVVNGYSDILSPLLIAAGGYAGATGWWGNLRSFTWERYMPTSTGGRQPNIKYLSKHLYDRISIDEMSRFRIYMNVLNGLSLDSDYNPEPERCKEVLQSWEVLKSIINNNVTGGVLTSLDNLYKVIDTAIQNWRFLQSKLVPTDRVYTPERLLQGIEEFKKYAELR